MLRCAEARLVSSPLRSALFSMLGLVLGTRLGCRGLRGSWAPFFHRMSSRPEKKRSFATMAAASIDVLDGSDFDTIRAELSAYDEKREQIIKRSRDIGKLSKNAIFALHRGDTAEAGSRIEGARKAAQELLPVIQANPTLRGGSFAAAIEEFAEAVIFREFLVSGRLATKGEVELADSEEYLGGVLDFTGELNRYAVARATVRDKEAVQRCRDLVEAIMGQFLQFDLRNGSLRKKFDALKYTLKKMEQTLYELELFAGAGIERKAEEVPDLDVAAAGAASMDDDM